MIKLEAFIKQPQLKLGILVRPAGTGGVWAAKLALPGAPLWNCDYWGNHNQRIQKFNNWLEDNNKEDQILIVDGLSYFTTDADYASKLVEAYHDNKCRFLLVAHQEPFPSVLARGWMIEL